jgi:GTP-binding protein LepA
LLPERYLGSVMKLCMEKRGVNSNMNTPPRSRELSYEMPLPKSF